MDLKGARTLQAPLAANRALITELLNKSHTEKNAYGAWLFQITWAQLQPGRSSFGLNYTNSQDHLALKGPHTL